MGNTKKTLAILEGNSSSISKAAKQMSREMTKQNVTVARRNAASQRKKVGKNVKKSGVTTTQRIIENQRVTRKRLAPVSKSELNSRLNDYFKALQNPWEGQGVRCPVNYNPVPSFLITQAHTTRTVPVLTVVNGTTTQLTLFPGHSFHTDNDAMDGVSYHAGLTRINGINYPVGPLTLGVNACIGAETTSLASNADVNNLDTVNSTPMSYDVNLPYSAATGNGGHSRWKLVSMGIMLENTTPIQTRGGTVQHVMPSTQISSTGVLNADYNSQPTFRVTAEANSGVLKLSWIPRADDLAFWHIDSSASVANGVLNAGLIVWITAPSGGVTFNQTYSYQVVCNWELSGHSLAAISAPTVHQPADKNIVEPVISALQFTQSHATNVVNIAKSVATHAPALAAQGSKLGSYVLDLLG